MNTLTITGNPHVYPNPDYVKPLGSCEYCGGEVHRSENCRYDEALPYKIDGVLLHEMCIMNYAHQNWRVE